MILAETADFIVANKPRGWLTIPGRDQASKKPILVNKIREQFGKIYVVHRLDVVTSGVILFARNDRFHKLAQAAFQNRNIEKSYLAIAEGKSSAPAFMCNEPIDEKPSQTFFKVMRQGPAHFLVNAKPRTGRLHQIRKHLAGLGHAVLGDVAYGAEPISEPDSIALHAETLSLKTLGTFTAPLPADFKNWLKQYEIPQ